MSLNSSVNASSQVVNESKEAQVNRDDQKQQVRKQKISQMAKIVIPNISDEVLQSLPQDLQDLYNMKIEFKLNESNDSSSLTFYPSPFLKSKQQKTAAKCLFIKSSILQNISQKQNIAKPEAYRDWNARIVNERCPSPICSFIRCALQAWTKHIPLRLKPQHIWLLILQAIAMHVDSNAEALREKFVTHEGKKELVIIRDSFVRGSKNNDWKGVIEEFVEQIDKYTVADTVELFESDFSTSTIVDQIATKVTVMDICKNYFRYTMMTMCGFPSITLEGTKEDWMNLRQKCEKLLAEKVMKEFGDKWALALLPLIDRFIVAYDGEIDGVFWNSMIKRGAHGGSGSWSWYSGWINILFPIIKGKWNSFCVPYSASEDYVSRGLKISGRGNDVNKYPTGISSAPVEWKYYGQLIKLKFVAGFMGYTQDRETSELCANVEWFIGETKETK